jgi:hypothetical protein
MRISSARDETTAGKAEGGEVSDKLKPCPLCGDDAEMHYEKLCGTTIYMVKCSADKCQCQEMGWHETETDATNVWNTRPIDDALQARIAELETTLQEIHQHYDDTHAEEVNELNARIAELKKSAVVWHKYPDEKPQKTDHYLIHCPILNKRHFDFWHNDIQKWDRYDEYVIHWAYLPEPPDREPKNQNKGDKNE